jgi:hypothetical protein
MPFHDKMPRLDLVAAEAQKMSDEGLDVHTFNVVLYDGSFWQVRIEATDDDMQDVTRLFVLDKYGERLDEVAEHRP